MNDTGDSATSRATTLRRGLTTLPLVAVMYFNISGGPFSTEGLVAQVGPGMALLMLLLVPLLWSLPETLLIAELASMLPVEGGYYRWVQRAFGDFWAFQNGWLTWLYSLVDMAIYPVLFNQSLRYFFPTLTGTEQWLVALAVIWGATAVNLRGALPVGRTALIAGLLVLGSFLALSILALPHASHVPWLPLSRPDEGVAAGMGVALSTAVWNYIGWDNASTVQGEVQDAGRTYPRALAIALPVVVAGYLIPLLATLSATDWTQWHEGGWPVIAASLGPAGAILAPLVAFAGLVSPLVLFGALLLVYSRIPLVMAADGLLPHSVARLDARGTPRNAVVVSACCYSVFVLLPFGELVVADVVLYALALGLEFAALVALRRKEPLLRGSFRLPLGTAGVALLAAIPSAVLIAVVLLSFWEGEYGMSALVGAAVGIALGPILYAALNRLRRRTVLR